MKGGMQAIAGMILWVLVNCGPTTLKTSADSNFNSTIVNTDSLFPRKCIIAPVKDGKLLVLDSAKVSAFIARHPESSYWTNRLSSFYKKKQYAYVWMNVNGLNEAAGIFVNLLNDELDSVFRSGQLPILYHKVSSGDCAFSTSDSLVIELELLLSAHFFEYAHRNWKGMSESESMKLGWFIDRKKLDYEALLDSLLTNNLVFSGDNEPVYRQYTLLKKQLRKYAGIEKKGGWPLISKHLADLKKGDTSFLLLPLKKQLFIMGDLKELDSNSLYDEKLSCAIKDFQERHGLKPDSVLGPRTISALRVPVHERIEQILINMERSRWVPTDFTGDYLMVNIPDFKLSVYNNDRLEWTCKVVLGKQSTTTVIFNDYLEYIVFSPYWNVPESIVQKEIIPEIKKDKNYLAQHNMEIITLDKTSVLHPDSIPWNKYESGNFPYILREKPGKENSLGLVKFLFPNSYHIYLHDTPSKSLFDKTTRTFSHGCIRIEKPFELAQYLLREDSVWTEEKILELMNGGKETFVKLKNKVPVFVVYFTAWVDANGDLQFRKDIYGHDAKMKTILFL